MASLHVCIRQFFAGFKHAFTKKPGPSVTGPSFRSNWRWRGVVLLVDYQSRWSACTDHRGPCSTAGMVASLAIWGLATWWWVRMSYHLGKSRARHVAEKCWVATQIICFILNPIPNGNYPICLIFIGLKQTTNYYSSRVFGIYMNLSIYSMPCFKRKRAEHNFLSSPG